jgi:hypothetical protein
VVKPQQFNMFTANTPREVPCICPSCPRRFVASFNPIVHHHRVGTIAFRACKPLETGPNYRCDFQGIEKEGVLQTPDCVQPRLAAACPLIIGQQ